MKSNLLFSACAVLILLSGALSCTHKRVQQSTDKYSRVYQTAAKEYYLQSGDNLDIKFFYNPELNENVTIRPDGKISLQLVDEVKASGLTPALLDDELTKKYSEHLKSPIITVIVKDFEGQRIYVGGEVNSPQVLNVIGTVNALQAIFNAGGFAPDAKPSSVVIISRGAGKYPVVRLVNMKKALAGDLAEKEFVLHPYDMIYVPKTYIAKIDQFLTHLYSFIPPQIGLSFSYELRSAEND